MIREKFYKNIVETIDNHYRFDSSDFKLENTKSQNGTIVVYISYNIEPKYKITFKIPNSTTAEKDGYRPYYAFSGSVCPGPFAFEETFSFQGEAGVFERISTWLNCIWEELASNPIVRQVETQQKQIDEIFEKFENIKDEYFTVDEATELKKRLDELEETLKSHIQQKGEEKKIYEQEIARLHTDIDTLKETVNTFNKKGWLRSFTSKVFKWTKNSENRKLIGDGYKLIKEFLPENIKSSLPN